MTAADPRIEIIDYRSKHRRYFQDLNYEWLERYFEVEPFDRIVLTHPEREILKRGGFILMALCDAEIAGTCALLKHTDFKYELAKMGVSQRFQGKGVGRRLVEAAIDRARAAGATDLVLATSPKLEAANHLYRTMGFEPADEDVIGPLPYARHSIVMARPLTEDR